MKGSDSLSLKIKSLPTRNHLKGRLHKYFIICRPFFQGVEQKNIRKDDFMMKSLLEAFFHGNIYSNEKFTQTSEYRQLNNSISKIIEFLEHTLSGDNFKKLEDLQGLLCQSSSIENEQYFSLGFKLGTLIMVEVFSAEEEFFSESN